MANDTELGINIRVSGGAAGAADAQKLGEGLKNVGVSAEKATAQAKDLGAAMRSLNVSMSELDKGNNLSRVISNAEKVLAENRRFLDQTAAAEEERVKNFSAHLDDIIRAGGEARAAANDAAAGHKGGMFGHIGGELKNLALDFGLVVSSAEMLKRGFEEFSEDEHAQVALTKMGVAAEDLAKAGEMVDQIEWITGDKVSAAEMLGRVLNGNTRELKRLGIEVEENASKEERWAAAQKLAERGLQTQAAMAHTLTGQFRIFGKGFFDNIGQNIKGLSDYVGATDGLDKLNVSLGFIAPLEERRAAEERMRQESLKTEAAIEKETNATNALKAANDQLADSLKASKLVHEEFRKELERSAKVQSATDEADLAGKVAGIDERQASGEISAQQAEELKRKAQSEAKINAAGREKDNNQKLLDDDQKQRTSLLEDLQTARHQRERAGHDTEAGLAKTEGEIDQSKQRLSQMDDGPDKQAEAGKLQSLQAAREAAKAELDKMDKALSDIEEQVSAVDDNIKEHTAAIQVSDQKLRAAQAESRSSDAGQKIKENSEREKRQEDFKRNAENLAKAQSGQSEKDKAAAEKRNGANGEFADSIAQAAEFASSPEQRERLRKQADRLRNGGSEREINDAKKEADRILERRSRSKSKRGEEAAGVGADLDRKAQAAVKANAEKPDDSQVSAKSQEAATAANKMQAEVSSTMNTFIGALNGSIAAMQAATAKAQQAQRTAGMGGAGGS